MSEFRRCRECNRQRSVKDAFCEGGESDPHPRFWLTDQPICSASSETSSPVAILEFDWGETPITGAFLVGRDDASPIGPRLEAEERFEVSCRHAEILVEGGEVYVRDLNSTNGTRLNSRPIGDRKVQALDGDIIEFSRQLSATLHIPPRSQR